MTVESNESTHAPATGPQADVGPRAESASEAPSRTPAGREEGGRPHGGPRSPDSRGAGRPQRRRFVRRFHRRKVCRFCVAKVEYIDYKDARRLRRFMSERGKILPRRVTGCCAKHQRMLTSAIKRARNVALLPYKAE